MDLQDWRKPSTADEIGLQWIRDESWIRRLQLEMGRPPDKDRRCENNRFPHPGGRLTCFPEV